MDLGSTRGAGDALPLCLIFHTEKKAQNCSNCTKNGNSEKVCKNPRGQRERQGRRAKFHVSSVSEEEMRRRERKGRERESQNRIIFHTSRVPPLSLPSHPSSNSIALSLSPPRTPDIAPSCPLAGRPFHG